MHFLFQLTVVFEDKLMGIHSLFLWYSICEIEKNPFFSCCFVKVMNESSIELIKDSCCFRMGGNCASSLLKNLFVAWSGLRYSFYHVMEKGQPSSFCSLLAAGQVTSVSLDCELRLWAYTACFVLRSRVNGITILIFYQFAHRGKDS